MTIEGKMSYGLVEDRTGISKCKNSKECNFQGLPHFIDCPNNPTKNLTIAEFEAITYSQGILNPQAMREIERTNIYVKNNIPIRLDGKIVYPVDPVDLLYGKKETKSTPKPKNDRFLSIIKKIFWMRK